MKKRAGAKRAKPRAKPKRAAASASPPPTLVVTAQVLAQILELTPRRIRQFAEDGEFPRAGRGLFDLTVCLPIYIRKLRQQAKDENREIERASKLLDLQMRQADVGLRLKQLTTVAAAEQLLAEHATRVRAVHASAPARYARWFPELPRAKALERLQQMFDAIAIQLQRDEDPAEDPAEEEKPAA